MSSINENKFYQALESIFTGANIEGDSGYVNLLKIKSIYYKLILEEFKKSVNNEQIITDSFKEEFFDKLYSFFEKYFSESGSVYFVKTANWQRVYEQVYTDNKDVVLFWKTHMLYYVKSDILFQSIDVNITDEESKQEYNFYFDVGNLQAKQNNEKKSLVFSFREKIPRQSSTATPLQKGNLVYIFDVSYSERGAKTKTDDIIKTTKIPEKIIEKAFATFKKQSEVDFFINKNAQKFLTEQLDMYLHQILLNEENKFEQKRLDQLKTIKTFTLKIIKFIAQFEDELVRVWNKPKFALNSNYVITLDKLNTEIIEKIAKHENLPKQVKEWQELGMVDENPFVEATTVLPLTNAVFAELKNKYLPIDTKYFKDLEIEILSLFDNIDEALDGRLIHSENYQALNTLQEKYKEKIQCIYIDPPFNTGSDFAYMDKFQDSTWLSLMNDRIELARKFLRDDGSFYLHLDHNAIDIGRLTMDKIFGDELFQREIIWGLSGVSGYKSLINNFVRGHETMIFYSKTNNFLFNKIFLSYDEKQLARFTSEDKDGRKYKTITKDRVLYLDEAKGIPISDTWNDIASFQTIVNSPEITGFSTQKPEKLLERILLASSNENTLIFDFFTGSATTIATAHKLGRKWLGVEMGDHFDTVDLPRMKTVLWGKITGISKDLMKQETPRQSSTATPQEGNYGKLKVGGFFKYYSLEQYEDTLRNMQYKDYNQDKLFTSEKKVFEQYVFYADQKFAHMLEVKTTPKIKDFDPLERGNELEIDFDKLVFNQLKTQNSELSTNKIDFAETISNLLGFPIKKITKNSVVLQDGDSEKEIKTDYKNMTDDEKVKFLQILKPLIWWGE